MANTAKSGKATANQNSQQQVNDPLAKYFTVNPEALAATNHQIAVRRANSNFGGKELVQHMLVTFPEPIFYKGGRGVQLGIRVMEADGSFRMFGTDGDAPKDYMEISPAIKGVMCKWPVQPDHHINGYDLYAVTFVQIERKPEVIQAEIQQHFRDFYDENNGVWMEGEGPLTEDKLNKYINNSLSFDTHQQKVPLISWAPFAEYGDEYTMSGIEARQNRSAGVQAESEPGRGRGVRQQLTNRTRTRVAPAVQQTATTQVQSGSMPMPAMGNLLQP